MRRINGAARVNKLLRELGLLCQPREITKYIHHQSFRGNGFRHDGRATQANFLAYFLGCDIIFYIRNNRMVGSINKRHA